MLKGIFCFMILGWSLGSSWCLDICKDQVEGARLAHPGDCSRFIICRGGITAQIRYCPFGLHFNRFDAICDLQYRAGCDIRFSRQLFDNEGANGIDCDACRAMCSSPPGNKPCNKPEKPTTTPCPTPKPTTQCRPTVPPPTIPTTPPTPPTPPTTKPCRPTPPTPPPSTKPCRSTRPQTPSTRLPSTKPCRSTRPTTPPTRPPSTKPCRPPTTPPPTKPCRPPNPNPNPNPNPELPQTGPSGTTCADRGKCEGQRDGAMFAANTGYVVCQCQCEVLMPCPAGLIFNEAKQTCDWPQY